MTKEINNQATCFIAKTGCHHCPLYFLLFCFSEWFRDEGVVKLLFFLVKHAISPEKNPNKGKKGKEKKNEIK